MQTVKEALVNHLKTSGYDQPSAEEIVNSAKDHPLLSMVDFRKDFDSYPEVLKNSIKMSVDAFAKQIA